MGSNMLCSGCSGISSHEFPLGDTYGIGPHLLTHLVVGFCSACEVRTHATFAGQPPCWALQEPPSRSGCWHKAHASSCEGPSMIVARVGSGVVIKDAHEEGGFSDSHSHGASLCRRTGVTLRRTLGSGHTPTHGARLGDLTTNSEAAPTYYPAAAGGEKTKTKTYAHTEAQTAMASLKYA